MEALLKLGREKPKSGRRRTIATMRRKETLCGMIVLLVFSGLAWGDYISEIMDLNPVGYWRLGEMSPTTAYDEVGGNNGTYNSVTLGADGALYGDSNKSAVFTGNPSHTEISHSDSYLLNNGTIQFWFKDLDSIRNAGLFSKDSGGYDTGGHVTAHIKSGRVKVDLQSTSQNYTVETPTINPDTWYLFTLTFGDGGMNLYLNDALVDSNAYTGGLGTSSGGIGNYEPIVLGANAESSGNEITNPLKGYFTGQMDEVAIFDRALMPGEVSRLHEVGLTGMTGIPEPATIALLAMGIPLFVHHRRRS